MFQSTSFPPGALEIIRTLRQEGHQAYFVGGCVRDLLLGIPVREWDITTSAEPRDVSRLFPRVIPTGIEFGTVTVLLADGQYEVTTFRSDERYVDGRHPLSLTFTKDIHQDLCRRDFTINALAYDPEKKELIDDWEGQKDLKRKLIRAIGDPLERFLEDGLRPIRACRFAARLGFEVEKKTLGAMARTIKVTRKVALERVHDELVKLLEAPKPSSGFELMRRSGILALFLPELAECYGVKQPRAFHKYDVYWHSLHACDAAPPGNLVVRLAALLHDVSKPACKEGDHFYGHDQEGAKVAEGILRRLKFSNQDIAKVANLIRQHMFNYESSWTDAAVRRFMRRVGVENLDDLFALRGADMRAMEREIDDAYLHELKARIRQVIQEEQALHVKDLKVDGNDVMATLNLKPGPEVGKVLSALLERVLDDPRLNHRETLLKMIKDHA